LKGTGFKLVYIVVFIAAAVLYLSSSTLKNIFSLKAESVAYERRLQRLKEENKDLNRKFEWVETEEDYIKFVAKDRLGLVEPGEKKMYIVDGAEE
jgi:cell division protein FtsB